MSKETKSCFVVHYNALRTLQRPETVSLYKTPVEMQLNTAHSVIIEQAGNKKTHRRYVAYLDSDLSICKSVHVLIYWCEPRRNPAIQPTIPMLQKCSVILKLSIKLLCNTKKWLMHTIWRWQKGLLWTHDSFFGYYRRKVTPLTNTFKEISATYVWIWWNYWCSNAD